MYGFTRLDEGERVADRSQKSGEVCENTIVSLQDGLNTKEVKPHIRFNVAFDEATVCWSLYSEQSFGG